MKLTVRELKKMTFPILPAAIAHPAAMWPGSASKFSATLHTSPLGLNCASYWAINLAPEASGATGFSLRTCLPAASAFRTMDGCWVIGRTMMTEEISGLASDASRLDDGSPSKW